jgi:OFA family oxalate/formate antiporter-like MFS transporter
MSADAIARSRAVVAQNTVTLAAASVAMFLLGAIYAYGVLLPALMADFSWSRATAALPHAVLLFIYAVGMALGGAMQDRTSPTGGAMLGGLLFGGGLLLAGSLPGLAGLVGAYGILGGIGFGFTYVACVTAAMRSFPDRRGLAAGAVVGAFGLGAFVWAPLAQAGLAELGWDGVLRGYGGLCFVLLPLLGLGIRAPHPAHGAHALRGVSLARALRAPLFWTVFAAYTLVTAVGLLLLAHLVNYATDQGLPAASAAWLLSASAVGSGAGRFFMGWLSDRWGRLPCLIGASVVEVALLLALALAHGPLALFLLAAATGFAFGTWLALYGPIATDLFGMRAAGAIYGALYLSYGLGGLLGPTLGGALADATGGYRLTFLAAAVLTVLGTLLFILATQLHPPRYPHPPALEEEIPLGG